MYGMGGGGGRWSGVRMDSLGVGSFVDGTNVEGKMGPVRFVPVPAWPAPGEVTGACAFGVAVSARPTPPTPPDAFAVVARAGGLGGGGGGVRFTAGDENFAPIAP